jgi:cyclase
MLAKRIIACLDVADGRVVKGTNFVDLRDAGDPVELAERYSQQGADEIAFLDISATHEGRQTLIELVRETARRVFVPLTVGGGIRCLEDAYALLRAGADKVSVNSAAVARPELIEDLAKAFGSQAVVLAIDAQKNDEGWMVSVHGGRRAVELNPLDWAARGEALGAGEILLTSMSADGTKQGFDLALTSAVANAVNIPVIASGGAGSADHFATLFQQTNADAGLAASIFHYQETAIPEVKRALAAAGIRVRPA